MNLSGVGTENNLVSVVKIKLNRRKLLDFFSLDKHLMCVAKCELGKCHVGTYGLALFLSSFLLLFQLPLSNLFACLLFF